MQKMNSDVLHIHSNALCIKVWLSLRLLDLRLRLLPSSWNTKLLQPRVIEESTHSKIHPMQNSEPSCVIDLYISTVSKAARSRFFFNTSCLRRSLVLRNLLHKAGIEAKLVYGLSLHTKGTGHAWLEVVSPPSVRGQKIDTLSNPDNFITLGKGGPVDGN